MRGATDYVTFLASKQQRLQATGLTCSPHESLFQFQRDLVQWAVARGQAAVFADCGLGKTRIQLEWARAVPGPVLIFAPLAVASQTVAEATILGMTLREVTETTDAEPFQIANYEKLHRFDPTRYGGVVLDESSILKSIDGVIRTRLLSEWTRVPYRLCCTATPSPNDVSELANHAEFVGAMPRVEMLATFFVHDDLGWRLKGHAQRDFWRWVATWAMFVRAPSDLGYPDDGFALPALDVHDEVVASVWRPTDGLFADVSGGIRGRLAARRHSIENRVARAAEIIQAHPGPWLVWCGLNDEAIAMEAALGPDCCVQIAGKDSEADKIARELRWRTGEVQTLVTKPKIFGHGMNWQHCSQVIFLGLGDSFEQYYQAVRRCWRFGQQSAVDVIIVISDAETGIAANVRRKEAEAARLAQGVVDTIRADQQQEVHHVDTHAQEHGRPALEQVAVGDGWRLMLGDCVTRIAEVDTASVGLSVFSPPFASLYTYSASDQDMGNSRSYDEFFSHFRFLLPELLRVTMPGRRACVHVQQLSTTQATHGVIGWRDFRADMVREFIATGFVYDGEVVIDSDPQQQAIRTHAKGLLFAQKERDAAWLRPAMADYILPFRAPGDNPQPVKSDVTNDEWISWARPIWYGIARADTLNVAAAREVKDERHICPLQLGTIERCVRLWSNPGDLVLDPFAGIGSTGYSAIRHERRFVGIELKESYWRVAVSNLKAARRQAAFNFGVEQVP